MAGRVACCGNCGASWICILLLRRSLHEFQQDDYSKLVDLLNDPAKQSLSEYSRDEAWKILWRVCLSQPRLILLGLRGLLTHSRSLRLCAGRACRVVWRRWLLPRIFRCHYFCGFSFSVCFFRVF